MSLNAWDDPLNVQEQFGAQQQPDPTVQPPSIQDQLNHIVDNSSRSVSAPVPTSSAPGFYQQTTWTASNTPQPLPLSAPAPATTSPASHDTSSSSDTPMDINATRTSSVSAEERERRRINRLCYWCGGEHRIADCPTCPQDVKNKSKKKVNIV